jgi:hypothetical protein
MEMIETEFTRWANFCTGMLVLAVFSTLGLVAYRFITFR